MWVNPPPPWKMSKSKQKKFPQAVLSVLPATCRSSSETHCWLTWSHPWPSGCPSWVFWPPYRAPHSCAGVQVCRCAGVQVCRCAGVQVYRCTGVQVYRCTGVQVYRCTGVQVYRCAGVWVCGCAGVEVRTCELRSMCIVHCALCIMQVCICAGTYMYTIQGSRYVSVARIVMLTFLLLAMSCPVVGLVWRSSSSCRSGSRCLEWGVANWGGQPLGNEHVQAS